MFVGIVLFEREEVYSQLATVNILNIEDFACSFGFCLKQRLSVDVFDLSGEFFNGFNRVVKFVQNIIWLGSERIATENTQK